MRDVLRYDKMVEQALRGVVREALAYTAANGLPGAHHFYITFRTGDPGAELPDHLRAQYPGEMTVVLEHQFWDLDVREELFSVTLTFNNKPERLVVPFGSITAFADPSVKFGLQFQPPAEEAMPAGTPRPAPTAAASAATVKAQGKPGEVVTLDSFRKR